MFEKCLYCDHSGKDCIQYVMSLQLHDIITWCKERKDKIGITNAKISELTGIPKGTIDRMFSESEKLTDFRFSTVQPVVMALTGAADGDADCESHTVDIEAKRRIERLEHDNARLTQHMEEMKANHQTETDFLKQQLEHEQATSESRKKAFYVVAIALGVTLSVIILALIVDRLNPNIGFFWLDRVSAFIGDGVNATGQSTIQLL